MSSSAREAAARGVGNAVSPLHGPAAPGKTFCGYRLLAVDGSSLKSAAYPEDPASYRPGTPRQHGWNLWYMNALFNLENGIYTDLIVQKEHEKNECRALCQMADRSRISGKVILPADRNYESCNNLANLEKWNWNYLIRIRDKARGIAYGMPLPNRPEFDIPLPLLRRRLLPLRPGRTAPRPNITGNRIFACYASAH